MSNTPITVSGWAVAVDLDNPGGMERSTYYWHGFANSLPDCLYRTRAEAERHITDLAHTRWRNQRAVRVSIEIREVP